MQAAVLQGAAPANLASRLPVSCAFTGDPAAGCVQASVSLRPLPQRFGYICWLLRATLPHPGPWSLARRERGEAAAEDIRSSLGMYPASSLAPGDQARGRIEVLQCDLADLKAVEGLVKEVKRRTKTTGLSMLLCNAGGQARHTATARGVYCTTAVGGWTAASVACHLQSQHGRGAIRTPHIMIIHLSMPPKPSIPPRPAPMYALPHSS